MKKSGIFALAISAALPFTANAETPGIYTSLAAGVNMLDDANAEGAVLDNDVDFDTGWVAGGALGYAWSTGIRAELELQYLTNDINSIDGFASASGDQDTWALTLNLLYDFMRSSPFNPYVGIGAGPAWVNWDATDSATGFAIDDTDTSVAIKGIAGASYKLSRAVSLFSHYQYMNVVNLNFQSTTGLDAESQMENHSVLAGVRVAFGSPETPPPPAPVAAPPPPPAPVQDVRKSRSYMIFFDFDKTAITPEARKILQQVVADVKSGNAVELQITAHADKSGTDNYNQRLSERRATSTKKELLKLGLPSVNVVMSGKGETQPLVPTPDGTREPQNRRAEIVYILTEKP